MSEVLEKMASTGSGLEELEPLQVISAFDVPRFQYNVHRKMYFPTRGDLSLHGEPGDKMQVHIGRMHLLQQRLRRNSLFSTPAFAGLVAGSKGADCEVRRRCRIPPPRTTLGAVSNWTHHLTTQCHCM